MTDPVPSKDQVRLAALEHRLLSEEQEARAADIEHKLRFAWAQKKGARLIVDLRDEIERQQAQIATLKGYIERTALAGYRCAECAARLTAEACGGCNGTKLVSVRMGDGSMEDRECPFCCSTQPPGAGQ
jgi:hypothetical protein